MGDFPRGRRRRLSSSRAMVIDLLHYERKAPMCAHDRIVDLQPLIDVRSKAARRISWSILFLKAYGMLSCEFRPLRQAYMPWPWPHVYEHPCSSGTLTVSRTFEGEDRLFFLQFHEPEAFPLEKLQNRLESHLNEPVLPRFRRQVHLSRLPRFVRRAFWWTHLNLSGVRRVKRFGTFGMTTIAAHGAEIRRPPSMLTTTLTYGPFSADGECRATIAYDHRLMDGLTIARCLRRLEELLNTAVAAELAGIPPASETAHHRAA